jgi:hypothetical protein
MNVRVVVFLIAASAPALSAQGAVCYRYESDSLTLTGNVVRKVFPGRPNYESVKAGDAPDTVYVLQLARPLCTASTKEFDGKPAVREVQLYFAKEDASTISDMRGKSASLRGTLTGAVWGWHHLPVLFQVRVPKPRPVSDAV